MTVKELLFHWDSLSHVNKCEYEEVKHREGSFVEW